MIVVNEDAGINALPADLGWHDFESRDADTGGAKKGTLGVSKTPSPERELFFFPDQSAVMSDPWWWHIRTAPFV